MPAFRIGLAQINSTVGDLQGNAAKIVEFTGQARALGCDVVAFPELALTGYPPEDLLLRRRFVQDNQATLRELASAVEPDIPIIAGFVDGTTAIYNAAAVLVGGKVAGVYHKQLLPNYGVFDEKRYFHAGTGTQLFSISEVPVGVTVCEDIWFPDGPHAAQARAGAQAIININGSPYHRGKQHEREEMLAARARENGVIVCYVNLVGGQDELVFDGGSVILDQSGRVVARAAQFREELLVADLDFAPRASGGQGAVPGDEAVVIAGTSPAAKPPVHQRLCATLDPDEEVYEALVMAVRDYWAKNGATGALIGLSGGIDSSLVATIAVDALGPEAVIGVAMPSRYSSEGSLADAKALADNLGIRLEMLPIEQTYAAYLETLEDLFSGTEPGVAEENLQSRIRGNILMALSNKFGSWVITTGNKSEYATGYCTLYGDMAGGYAVLKDVPKTLVYRLSECRNKAAGRDLIPRSVFEKPPSAELRPDQRDTDSLPPYDQLDPVLELYIEEERSLEEIVSLGHDEQLVRRVMALVDRSEYKRRQSPPGVKITLRAFGRDRRLPIANRYKAY